MNPSNDHHSNTNQTRLIQNKPKESEDGVEEESYHSRTSSSLPSLSITTSEQLEPNSHHRPLKTSTSLSSYPTNLSPIPTPPHRRTSSQPLITVKEITNGSISPSVPGSTQRRLNHYLLIKTIGRGSFGTVELARDLNDETGQLYAIKEFSKSRMRKLANRKRDRRKLLKPSLIEQNNSKMSDGMELVKAEVAIMKKLGHPNIVTLYEVIDTNTDSLFFVLELCPYGPIMNLSTTKESDLKPLEELRSKRIFRQLILGIEYLHSNQILHRDIKPDNILYFEDPKTNEDPRVKIVDFGVSETFDVDDLTSKSAGSPAFLPPELCQSSGGTQGKAADIWAMGVTLYSLVVGKLPFEDTNPLGLSERIIRDPLVLPDELDESLKDIIERLLTKSPTERIEMTELRVHRWLTSHSDPPLPENVSSPIEPPTEHEIETAFRSLRSISMIVKAATRFIRSRRPSSQDSREMVSQKTDGRIFSSPESTIVDLIDKRIMDSPESKIVELPSGPGGAVLGEGGRENGGLDGTSSRKISEPMLCADEIEKDLLDGPSLRSGIELSLNGIEKLEERTSDQLFPTLSLEEGQQDRELIDRMKSSKVSSSRV